MGDTMGIMSKRFRRGVVVAAAAALVLAACGGGSSDGGNTPGVTDDEVHIGAHSALTGPAAAGLTTLPAAWQAYFDHVNANGGVNGRQIKLTVYDDAYQPDEASQAVRRLVQQDNVFAIMGGVGTPVHGATIDFLKANDVPDLFPSSAGEIWDQPEDYPNMFGWALDGVSEAKIIGTYIQDNFAGQSVCVFGQEGELNDMGLNGLTQVLGEDGITKAVTYTPSDPNIGPQISSLRDAGCEVVVNFSIVAFTALAMNTAADMGFEPQFMATWSSKDFVALQGLFEDLDRVQGFLATQFLPDPQDDTNSWTNEFTAIWEEYGPGGPLDSFAMFGFAQAYNFVQALEAAGEDLTRDALIDALHSVDFEISPGLTPLSYSTDDHGGYTGGQLARVEGDRFVPVGDVYLTSPEDGDAVEVYGDERPPAPEKAIP